MIYELRLEMPLFSKARPRLGAHGAFMPSAYKEKQRKMRLLLREQWKRDPLEGPIRLCVKCYGEARVDADNLIGALMDAAQGILWFDDRVSIIPEITVTWHKAKKAESIWLLTITELPNERV
jgi:Holliday junction resolvase RusA-like endonuclease